MNNNITYKDLIIKALKNLGGEASLDKIYKEVEKLAETVNKPLSKTFDATIRATLERYSSDSDVFNGKDDIFYLKEKGSGIWGIRDFAKESVQLKQNTSKYNTNLRFNNLKLKPYVIDSFYNSLKTKGFVILAGLSGTGKTKIFEEFVKYFPLKEIATKEKWIVIKDTKEKLLPVKKEEIKFNNGIIKIEDFIKSINEALKSETDRKVLLKINNYYTELVPVIEKLKDKVSLIGAQSVTNHLAAYIGCLFGFEIVEKEDIERLNLIKLERELEIKEIEKIINNHLFFPIRPDFKDSKSLLGFYNPLTKEYQKTPLLEFIINASKNYVEKGKNADPFFVLFDEMNLARVEYYFADFLSVLEAKRFESKEEAQENGNFNKFLKTICEKCNVNETNYKFTSQSIKLHSDDNLEDIPKELFLPPNLYFVGTVNIDETTHMFSPKVLDRAFTIEFDVESFEDYFENHLKNISDENSYNDDYNFTDIKEDFTNNGKFAIIDKLKIKEFLNKDENKKYLAKLNELNKILKQHNLHFGYRVFDEIMMFLYNAKNSTFKFNNLDEAFDLAIKMKVLPKFHGTRQRLETPIIELLKVLDIKEEIITKLKENSITIPEINSNGLKLKIDDKETTLKTNYPHTIKKLLEMFYKLKTQGFASFM